MGLKRSCTQFVNSVAFILLSFTKAHAEFDSAADKSLEKRLHSIYVQHYNRPILDSDWFKVVDAIEVQKHVVQTGDTLWGISQVYFGDGNYWSKLWSVNKGITNPHLIFLDDVIRFRTGSFDNTPGIDIEKNTAGEALAQNTEGNPSGSNVESEAEVSMDRPNPLPSFFRKTQQIEKSEEAPIIFIPRPVLEYKSTSILQKDILDQPAEVVGVVQSIGQYRMITAEGALIIVKSTTDLSVGGEYSIINKSPQMTKSGYPVHLQAVVRISRKIDDDDLYEGKILKQYNGIHVGDQVSTYQPVTTNANIGQASGIEVPIKILDEQKTLWSPGDTVFMELLDGASVAVGDVLKINNKFVDSVEFYVSNGYLKVVSVHPPFATGLIVNARDYIKSNSVSSPTYTGWSVW